MSIPFTPSSDDGAIEILRSIFGGVIDSILGVTASGATAATSMLAEAFRYFNSGVIFFGTIILMFVTVFGITNTANDGEALGKKWSTFYTPLRTVVSMATLIPSASGYAGVQIILLLIVTYSIGFASNLWRSVVEFSVGQQVVEQAIRSISDDPHFESLAIDALRMQVCAIGVSRAASATSAASPVSLQFVSEKMPTVTTTHYWPIGDKPWLGQTQTYQTKLYYVDAAWPSSRNICGQVVLTSTFDAPATTSNITANVTRSMQEAISNIRYKYITGLFGPDSGMTSLAATIVTATESPNGTVDSQQVSTAIAALKANLMNEITAEVKKQVGTTNADSARKLSEKGWVYAGSLYTELARIKDAIRSATSSRSEFVAGTSNVDGIVSGQVGIAVNGSLRNYNTVASEVAKKTLSKQTAQTNGAPKLPMIQTNFTAEDFSDGGNGIKTMITSWSNGLSTSLLDGTVHYLSEPNQDPVMRVKNVGDWMSTSALTIMTAQAAIGASLDGLKDGSAAICNQPIVGAPFCVATGFISAAASFLGRMWANISLSVSGLLYAGYYLGIWVPMIPFYIFAIGVVGWLIFIGEMLAAGVLWMAAHITPARDDSFIGSQSQGYLLVMSGFFRPALMVLGLVFSIAVLHPAVDYINSAFILSVRSVQADAVTGIFSLAAFMLGYCFLITSVFALVFSLPQTFPDRILKWIGAGIGDMGEQGSMQRLEGSASSQARTAATAAAARYAKGLGGGNGGGGGGGKGIDPDVRSNEIDHIKDSASPEGMTSSSTALERGWSDSGHVSEGNQTRQFGGPTSGGNANSPSTNKRPGSQPEGMAQQASMKSGMGEAPAPGSRPPGAERPAHAEQSERLQGSEPVANTKDSAPEGLGHQLSDASITASASASPTRSPVHGNAGGRAPKNTTPEGIAGLRSEPMLDEESSRSGGEISANDTIHPAPTTSLGIEGIGKNSVSPMATQPATPAQASLSAGNGAANSTASMGRHSDEGGSSVAAEGQGSSTALEGQAGTSASGAVSDYFAGDNKPEGFVGAFAQSLPSGASEWSDSGSISQPATARGAASPNFVSGLVSDSGGDGSHHSGSRQASHATPEGFSIGSDAMNTPGPGANAIEAKPPAGMSDGGQQTKDGHAPEI